MKRFILRAAVPVALALALLPAGTGTRAYGAVPLSFEVKLSGGAGFLLNGGGDLENSRLGMQAYAADYVEQYYTTTFDWTKASWSLPDLRGEFILRIGASFGVGIGAGYQSLKTTADYSFMYDRTYTSGYGQYVYDDTDIYADIYRVSNIPVFINFYGFLPVGNMSLYAYVGPSLNFGSYSMDRTNDWTVDNKFVSDLLSDQEYDFEYKGTRTDRATSTALGFQGGLGVRIDISATLAVGLEAYGRYLNFKNWTGTSDYAYSSVSKYYYEPWGWYATYNASGSNSISQATLYDDDWTWTYTDTAYNEMYMDEIATPPSSSSLSNVRRAEINFNAVGALVCIIIHF